MDYLKLFDEIVSIMENDYSGCIIKRNWAKSEYYREAIKQAYNKGELDRYKFKEIVDEYLFNFKDKHVWFNDNTMKKDNSDIGFRVRRYEDRLYIIQAQENTKLKVGMAIIEIEGNPIKYIAEKHFKELMNQPNERQLWENIIGKYKELTILDVDGVNSFKYLIYKYPKVSAKSKYEIENINEDTILLRVNDFNDFEQMHKLLSNNETELSSIRNLIIDVRTNSGGYDGVFIPLLEYIFPENYTIQEDYRGLTNITERNYNNRIEMIKEYLKEAPEDKMAKTYMEQLIENRGKGFVALDIDNQPFTVKGRVTPVNIVVITDRYCGSSGDSFVILSKHSPKVTVMGRPTYGVIDFSNVAEEKLDYGFSLFYATSVNEGVKYGMGYDNVGVKPHIYIPWTLEHLIRDVDLEYTLNFLKDK